MTKQVLVASDFAPSREISSLYLSIRATQPRSYSCGWDVRRETCGWGEEIDDSRHRHIQQDHMDSTRSHINITRHNTSS